MRSNLKLVVNNPHNQLEEKHCDHNAYISDNDVECEFCKMLNSQRDNYLSHKEETKYAKHNISILLAVKFTHYNQSFSDLHYNKDHAVVPLYQFSLGRVCLSY